jgi:TRAP-type C4-dicarboxylate transport system permease small subunit
MERWIKPTLIGVGMFVVSVTAMVTTAGDERITAQPLPNGWLLIAVLLSAALGAFGFLVTVLVDHRNDRS